jgi:hypothetical protein
MLSRWIDRGIILMLAVSVATSVATFIRTPALLHAGVLTNVSALYALPNVVPPAQPAPATIPGFEARLRLCIEIVRACLGGKFMAGPAFSAQLDLFMKSFVWAARSSPEHFACMGRELPGIVREAGPVASMDPVAAVEALRRCIWGVLDALSNRETDRPGTYKLAAEFASNVPTEYQACVVQVCVCACPVCSCSLASLPSVPTDQLPPVV